MFSQNDLSRIVNAMRSNRISSLKIEGDGDDLSLTLATQPIAKPSMSEKSITPSIVEVKGHALGRFVPCGLDDGLVAPEAGSTIIKGCILGYVALGNLRVALRAPSDGKLVSGGPKSGQIIGYGDPLFELEPSA